MRLFFLVCMCVASLFLFGCDRPVPEPPEPNRTPPTVYAFTTSWCSSCNKDKATLDKFESEGHKVVRVDIDKHPDWQQRYSITAVPEYMVVMDGRILVRTHDVKVAIQTVKNECTA